MTPDAYRAHDAAPPGWLLDMGAFDIGDGHWLAWQENGDLFWFHPCEGSGVGGVDVTSGKRHQIAHREPLTIHGSLLCLRCKAHGFVREGKWVGA